jgi:acyl homoserine lactone synthase
MKVVALSPADHAAQADLLAGMHRLRRRVFKDRLDWDVSVSGDMEVDRYDALGPAFLLVVTAAREVVGCVRLLPTLGPNMLADTFPVLLDGAPMPRSPGLAESSRFCVDTRQALDIGETGLRRATFMLFSAMIEWGLEHSPEGIVTVTDLRMERVLRRAAWPLARVGAPVRIGSTTAVAGLLEVSEAALARIAAEGDLDGRVLVPADAMPLAA